LAGYLGIVLPATPKSRAIRACSMLIHAQSGWCRR